MTYEQIEYTTADRIARVTLNRPDYRNAQSRVLLEELDDAFAKAESDTDVRVIVLSGRGEAFSSGHDLGTPAELADRSNRRRAATEVEAQFDYSWEHFLTYGLRWREIPKPTIAAVHGWCIFGGWLVASTMDLIVAADDAKFMTTLLQYFPLPFDVGVRKAKELLFDSHTIDAHEARELGFVNHVVPRAQLDSFTTELATRIASNAPFYLRMAKLAVNTAQDAMGFHAAVKGAHSHYQLSQTSNAQFRRKREREGDAPPPTERTRRMPLVNKILAADATTPREAKDPG